MESIKTMILGLWNIINNTTIFDNGEISFSLGTLILAFFIISITVSFIHIIIKGSGDKTHQEFTVNRKE